MSIAETRPDPPAWRLLLAYVRPHRWTLLAGALLSLLTGGRILVSPSVETSTDDFRVAPVPEPKKDEDSDPSRFDAIIEEASALYGVNSALVKAVIQAESRFNPLAVSPVGAKGLMQLMPIIAREYGALDPLDAKQNVFAA